MNHIYLMYDERKDYALFKVGFTGNIEQRVRQYSTVNADIKCISYIGTYNKSGRHIETMLHREIKNKGYEFKRSAMTGQKTEFFKVSYNDSFYNELMSKGLKAFKFTKDRKDFGCYVLSKD